VTDLLRKLNSNGARLVIAATSVALVFFPTIFQSINPPFAYFFLVITFWLLSGISIILLGYGFYICEFTKFKIPTKFIGLGNIFSFTAFLVLFLFIMLNMLADHRSRPRIVEISLSSPSLSFGEVLEFYGEAVDDNRDDTFWAWAVRPADQNACDISEGALSTNMRRGYWRVPASVKPGAFLLSARVSDGRSESECASVTFFVEE